MFQSIMFIIIGLDKFNYDSFYVIMVVIIVMLNVML